MKINILNQNKKTMVVGDSIVSIEIAFVEDKQLYKIWANTINNYKSLAYYKAKIKCEREYTKLLNAFSKTSESGFYLMPEDDA